MLRQNGGKSFLGCKDTLDALWRCYTDDKYGYSIEQAPEKTKPYYNKFVNCIFSEEGNMDQCNRNFINMIRVIIRGGNHKLNQYL